MAFPSGMFSAAGTMPTTLSRSFMSAAAWRAPNTLAAPHMSNFISSISVCVLMPRPPESNVIPLPTRTTGGAPPSPPWYSMTTSFGGWRRRLALQPVEAIQAVHDAEHRLLDSPAGVAAVHGKLIEAQRRIGGAARAQRTHRCGQRRVVAALDKVALRAQADEEHALGGYFR